MMALATIVSAVLHLFAAFTHPTWMLCPAPWWLGTGVQADGSFGCYLDADDHLDWPPIDARPIAVVRGRIFCATHPIVIDGHRVMCARRTS